MNNMRVLIVFTLLFTVQACAQSAAPTPLKNTTAKSVATKDDPVIRAALVKVAPNIQITNIGPSPIVGFKEVSLDGSVVYVSNDGKYLFQGALIDLATRKNLTDISLAAIRKNTLAAVPDSRKIIFAPANPKYTVTVFTDIDCGFCRKMHSQIAEYNKLGIAVDYLFFPRAGVGSESFQKAVNVWCAPNRNIALTMAKNDKSLPKKTCANNVAADYNLGVKIGVDGTPAVYAANGQQLGGYLSPQDLLKVLQNLN